MATRDRSKVFKKWRANALKAKGPEDPSATGDHETLIRGAKFTAVTVPPEWTVVAGEIDELLGQIETKKKELIVLHKKHLQPGIDADRKKEEGHEIEILTNTISRLIGTTQAKIKELPAIKPEDGRIEGSEELKIKANATTSYAIELQKLGVEFKKVQQHYLKRRRGMEEKGKKFGEGFEPDGDDDDGDGVGAPEGFNDAQLALVEHNDLMLQQRSADIQAILRSIIALQQMFTDLSVLVIEQGSILDQIDRNIEGTITHTQQAVVELEIANKTHIAYKRKLCIIFLVMCILIVVAILIFKPANASITS